MENVNISEFRSNLSKYLKKARQGQEINVTSHGETLATIVPPVDKNKTAKARLKKLAKNVAIHDVVGPVGDQWDALQ